MVMYIFERLTVLPAVVVVVVVVSVIVAQVGNVMFLASFLFLQ